MSPNFQERGILYYGDPGSIGMPGSVWSGCEQIDGSNDAYSRYLEAYNEIIESESEIDLSIQMILSEDMLQLSAEVELQEDLNPQNNKLIFLLTESVDTMYFSSVKYYEEIDLELSESGENASFSCSIPLLEEWHPGDLTGVVLIQDFSTYPEAGEHTILEAAKTGLEGVWPDFMTDITYGPAALCINFANDSYSYNEVISRLWDFGDGSTSSDVNPSHLYEEPGIYDVSLTISDGENSASRIKSGYISVEAGSFTGGSVAGIWRTEFDPYVVSGDVEVRSGSTLEIEPGVEIVMNGFTELIINGTMSAIGTSEDPIIFRTEETWNGLVFDHSELSILKYCNISGSVNGAVRIESSIVEINRCNLHSNTSTINAAAINILNSDNISINNNIIAGNYSTEQCGGILCSYSGADIQNNLIVNNSGEISSALEIKFSSGCQIFNNTIANNFSESCCIFIFNSDPVFSNNIVCDDGVAISTILSDPQVTYCCLSGGYPGENNFDLDPQFIYSSEGSGDDYFSMEYDWSISENSPCIDSGCNEVVDWDYDLAGEDRIINDIIDLGAYEYPGEINSNDVLIDNHNIFDLGNYPNPFNPTTTIKFDLRKAGLVNLEIYNIKGQKIRTLIDKQQEAGYHSKVWNGIDDSSNQVGSGIYFYRLKVDGTEYPMRKCLLIK